MVDILFVTGRLFAALFLVALNGFFVASEFALVRVRSTSVDQMVEEGRAGAETLQNAMGNLDDYLAATQLGITIASLGLGWIGEPAVAALIEPLLSPFLPAESIHLIAIVVGFSVVTFLHVVFGELAPKTIAIARAEQLALLVAPPMKLFYYIFLPGLVVFNGTANAATSLIGIPPASESEETLSEREIRMVLGQSSSEGMVGTDEVEMIEQVFELDDILARDVMIPRPDVVSVSPDASLSELKTLVTETSHTRYPVIGGEGGDRPLGYVDVKDLLEAEVADGTEVTAASLSRELPLVPETTTADELLRTFQSESRQMAAVIDEWGGVEGIATVEDVVEVIVGDLRDDFDEAGREPEIRQETEGEHLADGSVPIQQLNDELGSEFERSAYGTLGGLVLDRLGRPPEVDDEVTTDGYRFTVTGVDGARVEEIRIETRADDTGAEEDPGSE